MKRVLSLILAAVMVVSMFAGLQISSSALAASGKCGEKVNWSFDSSTGTLTISGEGDMYDYGYDSKYGKSPFSGNDEIIHIVILNGVTNVSDISGCENLKTVSMADSVTEIDEYAFFSCEKLESVKLSESLKTIGCYAFFETAIKNLYILRP